MIENLKKSSFNSKSHVFKRFLYPVQYFPMVNVWKWELDCEAGWALKNWCFWTVVLEKTLEGPLDCKEVQPVHSEGDQPWDFFGRNDAKAETLVLWPPHVKSWLIGKDSDAGRDWGQEKMGMTKDEMAGWHHGLNRRESEWTLGDGDGQGGLACCDSWGRKEWDTTEGLHWTELIGLKNPGTKYSAATTVEKSRSSKLCINFAQTWPTLELCTAQSPSILRLKELDWDFKIWDWLSAIQDESSSEDCHRVQCLYIILLKKPKLAQLHSSHKLAK